MPYITDERRADLDPLIGRLAGVIQYDPSGVREPTRFAGELNYVVTRLLLRVLPEKRYWSLALGIGTLICVIFEFYRRFVAPYEDKAIQKNGDIPEYEEAA
jgi:hypothetical protein